MYKRKSEFFIIDILIAIEKILRKTKHLEFDAFVKDENIVDIIMRNLEIIGEAASQILKQPEFWEDINIEWRKIVDFRNIIVHCYFGIDFDIVFNDIVRKEIPLLEKNILHLIKQKKDKTYFLQAVKDIKSEFTEMHRHKSILYLNKIENIVRSK